MRWVKYAVLPIGAGLAATLALTGIDPWLDLFPSKTADARQERPAVERRRTPVLVTRSEITTFRETVEAVGTARAKQYVDVVPLVAGRVERIAFTGGEQVTAGDVLVELDARAQEVTLKETEASLTEARNNFERIQDLRKRNVSSEAALEQARAAFQRAEAVFERARNDLADRTVRAPFSGVVGLRRVEEGARIDTGTVIASLDDLSEVEVEFSIPEIFLPRVKIGQPLAVRADAFPGRAFEGRVTTIDSRVSPAARAFKVRATVPNPDFALRTGTFVNLEIVLEERNSITVPEEAIVSEGASTFIFLVVDGQARRKEVRLGLRRGGRVEVLDGLKEAEPVVSSGVHAIEDGTPIRANIPDVAKAPPGVT